MKEKVKSVPKELVRRGLDDGTERLRGQLRDTAQRGQADDYGGDRIEDATVVGARRTVRGAEALIKKRAKGKGRIQDREPLPPADPPAPQDPPAEPPPQEQPSETSPQEPPRIKTREAVAAKDGGNIPADGGRTDPTPAAGSERQRIKIRDRDTPVDTPLTPQDKTQPPRIKLREPAVYDPPVGGETVPQVGSERPQIRTKETSAHDLCVNRVY